MESESQLADAAGPKPNAVDLEQVYSLNYSTRDEVRTLVKLAFNNQILFGSDAAVGESMRLRVAGTTVIRSEFN